MIDENGEQVGVVSLESAQARADDAGMDLIEVAPDAKPPVCKILDYGKLKFKESKKIAKARKASHQVILKEVRLRPKTEEHDFQVKLRNAIRFLEHGDKVQLTVMFRGREMQYRDWGMRHAERFMNLLTKDNEEEGTAAIAVVEQLPRLTGNRINMILAPKSGPKPKKKALPKPESKKDMPKAD